jgi:hypothetical protein
MNDMPWPILMFFVSVSFCLFGLGVLIWMLVGFEVLDHYREGNDAQASEEEAIQDEEVQK